LETVSKFRVLFAYLYALLDIYYLVIHYFIVHMIHYFIVHTLIGYIGASVIGRLVRCLLLSFLNGRLSGSGPGKTMYWAIQLRPRKNILNHLPLLYS
jgi:hypothetical protein